MIMDCPLLLINAYPPFKKKTLVVALAFLTSSSLCQAFEWEKEYTVTTDVAWSEMIGGGGQAIHPNQKVTILNESTIRALP